MIHIPYVSSPYLLDQLLGGITPYFHLYISAIADDPGITLADFDEADWPAYAPRRVTTWSPAVVQSGRAVSWADPQQWIRGTGGDTRDVYGYYATDTPGGPLLWWEPVEGSPLPMTAPSDSVLIRPRITLREDPEPET